MVNFCAIVGCGKRSDRDKETSFYQLPAVITHQGERMHELSEKGENCGYPKSTEFILCQVVTPAFAPDTLNQVGI